MRSTTLLVLSTYTVIVALSQTKRLHNSDYNGVQTVAKHENERDNPRGTSEKTTELQLIVRISEYVRMEDSFRAI
ncbi:unnamed protein product [Cylicocyclus nassatus]|uniref:Uncharacterized protein n=1 Tax=Cylicocyclus nassatus TaxID=53992 RepID=A0AA36M8M4_CYLNA|nr:unnamed protein product [Cylicocyclus nassatus]